TAAQVDAAYAKLALYDACLEVLSGPLHRSHDAYAGAAGRHPGEGAVPVRVPIAREALLACRARVPEARHRAPASGAAHAGGAERLAALDALMPVLDSATSYYANRDYERDRFRWGRKAHRDLLAAYERAVAAERALLARLAAQRAAWGYAELAVLAAEGHEALWQ